MKRSCYTAAVSAPKNVGVHDDFARSWFYVCMYGIGMYTSFVYSKCQYIVRLGAAAHLCARAGAKDETRSIAVMHSPAGWTFLTKSRYLS